MAINTSFCKTIWGQSWISLFCKLNPDNKNLLESLNYIDIGSIKGVDIQENQIKAIYHSTDEKYEMSIEFDILEEIKVEEIKNIIKNNHEISMQVNLGHLPDNLLNILNENKDFFNFQNINSHCYCKDFKKNGICKHITSLIAVLSDCIDKDNTLFFFLRGIDFDKIAASAEYLNKFYNNETDKNYTKLDLFQLKETKIAPIETKNYEFEKNNVEAVLSALPKNPMFIDRGDYKGKLESIYYTILDEVDSVLVSQNSTPVRNTEFYFIKGDDLKVFINPYNNMLLYLKSKGSLFKQTTEMVQIPTIKDGKIILESKEGLLLPPDVLFEYFFSYNPQREVENLSDSFNFLLQCARFAKEIVKSGNFIPSVTFLNDKFKIKYMAHFKDENIEKEFNNLKTHMPEFIYFDKKNQKILLKEGFEEISSLFITYLIHKIAFVKSSKINKNTITDYFVKDKESDSVNNNGINIAKSISNWLEMLTVRDKNIFPVLKIENSETDDFIISIDILNESKDETIPLKAIFDENTLMLWEKETSKIRHDIIKQLGLAYEFLPLLKDIVESKGENNAIMNFKDTFDFISTTSSILNGLGIAVLMPKNLKNLSNIQLAMKINLKSDELNSEEFFDNDRKTYLSFDELFNFSYEIAIGGEKISKEEFMELVKSTESIVKFKDKYVLLKPEQSKKILEQLNQNTPKFSSSMQLLHALLSGSLNEVDFKFDNRIKNMLEDFLSIKDVVIPTNLKGTLRPYQERGFCWLYSNVAKGFGSCIADDMGLGKTVQVLSLILKLKEENKLKNPILVACPTTLAGNWFKECQKFAPSLKVLIYHGLDRKLELENIDIIVTTYGLLRIDQDKFTSQDWDMFIIDEAQNIKNPDSGQSKAVKSIKAKSYIAMTGTPVENRLAELWSIFDFTNKDYMGSLGSFQKNYASPIEKYKDEDVIKRLRFATAPFILRRLKTDKSIINDLPEKNVIDEYCYLTKEQAALYEKVLQSTMKSIETSYGINRRGHIFKLITALKQICNHPSQYTKTGNAIKDNSGKADKLFSIIDNVFDNDEKALIFTQYKEMGDILVRMFKDEYKMDIPFFHGSVNRNNREKIVEDFQTNDKTKLMIISLKAGGTGLNLTAASNVIHYDLWWNPAVEQQATDRAYRIGQDKNVNVHRLVTLGTFEEKIDEMLKSKKELADITVVSGEQQITELSNKDLYELFSLTQKEF